MSEHEMKVTFVYGKVNVDPNPLSGKPDKPIVPGDTIVWTTGGKELQVEFLKYRDFYGPLESCDPHGPFIDIIVSPEKTVGMVRLVRPGRYFYNLLYKGEALVWNNPVDKDKEMIIAGGIDIPMTPQVQPTDS